MTTTCFYIPQNLNQLETCPLWKLFPVLRTQSENQYDFTSNKRKMLNSEMEIRNKKLREVILPEYLLSVHGIVFSLSVTLLPRIYLGKVHYLLCIKYVEII
jgi:hypothetical protein